MLWYMRADLRRIGRRIPRLIVLALLYIVLAAALVSISRADVEIAPLMILAEHYLVGFLPLVIGTIELSVILGDDFHARTMQQAIGMGISRTKIVLTKLLDLACLMLIDIIVLGGLIFASNGVFQLGMGADTVRELLLWLVGAWVKSVAYGSLSLIIGFYAQNALFALLVYIALSSGIASKMLGMALSMKALSALHLDRFLLTAEINTFFTHALLGYFDAVALIVILIYVVGGAMAASYLFKNTELEL